MPSSLLNKDGEPRKDSRRTNDRRTTLCERQEQAREMFGLYAEGWTKEEIAAHFDVPLDIVRRRIRTVHSLALAMDAAAFDKRVLEWTQRAFDSSGHLQDLIERTESLAEIPGDTLKSITDYVAECRRTIAIVATIRGGGQQVLPGRQGTPALLPGSVDAERLPSGDQPDRD